jgi:tRNA(Ile)-lysidine synthase
VAVAYSGGRDSTALLHATLQVAGRLDIEVVALHVHHGLSLRADTWLAHCEAACAHWSAAGHRLRFACERLRGAPARGDSVEAWARRQRYAALRAMALEHAASIVLLAHHRRDQAETFLLQALRGGGVAGLSGMPRKIEREGVVWARPWLHRPREQIEAYVHRHRLEHIDDDTNDDMRYARNRLRKGVWPALDGAFAQSEEAFASAAAWAQEATSCLSDLASIDLARIASEGRLALGSWLELSGPRRSNALRTWLRGVTGMPANAALVQRLLEELPTCRSGRWPLALGELRSYRGTLRFSKQPTSIDGRASPRETTLQLSKAGTYALPGWGGVLQARRVEEGGIGLALLNRVELVHRSGAEQFQAGPGRPARSLKKQFQSAAVPSSERHGPLLYSDGRLLFVSGLGIDARAAATPGEPQLGLEWISTGLAPQGAARSRSRGAGS